MIQSWVPVNQITKKILDLILLFIKFEGAYGPCKFGLQTVLSTMRFLPPKISTTVRPANWLLLICVLASKL